MPSKPGYSSALPHLAELADDLVEHVAREVGIGDAEALLLGRRRAAAHAELEAPFRQVVEHRDAFRRRAGWLTGGVTLKMPEPMWIDDVAAAR